VGCKPQGFSRTIEWPLQLVGPPRASYKTKTLMMCVLRLFHPRVFIWIRACPHLPAMFCIVGCHTRISIQFVTFAFTRPQCMVVDSLVLMSCARAHGHHLIVMRTQFNLEVCL
jgi:hypothetical protein